MLKMIYNSLTDHHNADDPHGPEHGQEIQSRDIAGTDIRTGITHENLRLESSDHENESGIESDHVRPDHVSDIGTDREKLREIRDWHLSKAQMSWSLETQGRHQQFVTWLEDAIQALDNKS